MPETLEHWTAARVRELPDDGNRYEVVDGELFVTPAPSYDHQHAVGELFAVLRAYRASVGLGHAVMSPADIQFDPATLVQPDVFVVPLEAGRRPKRWVDIRALLLAVEVLSQAAGRGAAGGDDGAALVAAGGRHAPQARSAALLRARSGRGIAAIGGCARAA